MLVEMKDGSCRECGGQLEIIDADDDQMTVRCRDCGEEYLVETDAFGDGGMHYHLGYLLERGQ
jgi:DNA-directed RNA polymerase subunit RPC12/RpoP